MGKPAWRVMTSDQRMRFMAMTRLGRLRFVHQQLTKRERRCLDALRASGDQHHRAMADGYTQAIFNDDIDRWCARIVGAKAL